jgi:transcriptional regulator with XRE-family HTH domain
MLAQGMKQKDLAERLGVHQTTVSSWRLGRVGDLEVALAIEKVTSVPVAAWAEEASDEEIAAADQSGEHRALPSTGT